MAAAEFCEAAFDDAIVASVGFYDGFAADRSLAELVSSYTDFIPVDGSAVFLASLWVVKPNVTKALSTVLICCRHSCQGADTASSIWVGSTGSSIGF